MKKVIYVLLAVVLSVAILNNSGTYPVHAEEEYDCTVRLECVQIWNGEPPADGRTLLYTITPESENYPLPTGGLSGGPRGSYLFSITLEETTLLLNFPFTHAGEYYYTVQAYPPEPPADYYTYSQNVYRIKIIVIDDDVNGGLLVSPENTTITILLNGDNIAGVNEESEVSAMIFCPGYLNPDLEAVTPNITNQPEDLELTYGYSSGSLSVTVEQASGHSYSYQWFSFTDTDPDPVMITDAVSSEYVIPAGKTVGTKEYYYCTITAVRTSNGNSADISSSTAAVTVREIAAPDQEDLTEEELPSAVEAFKEDGNDHLLVVDPGKYPEGYTKIQYSLDGQNWTDDPPTGNEAGEYTIYVRYVGDGNHESFELTEPLKVTVKPEYLVTEGGDGEWTKGSGVSFNITVKRLSQDEKCFEQFCGVLIDSEEQEGGYEAAKGSTIITLDPVILENLSEGSHTVTIVFKDGSVDTSLTIKAGESSSESSSEESSESGSPSEGSSENVAPSGESSESGSSAGENSEEGSSKEENSNTETTGGVSNGNEARSNIPATGFEDYLGVYLCMMIVSLMCLLAAYRFRDNRKTK